MKKANIYILSLAAIIFAIMNFAIWQKEQVIGNGETVYLKLAPVDPRSLMQGDYMQLNYATDNLVVKGKEEKDSVKRIVVKLDEKNIGNFVRVDNGQPLAANERVFRITSYRYSYKIQPNTFFFQEGHGKYFEPAKYGIFTFAKNKPDDYLLTGLADEDLKEIIPPNP